MGTVRCSLSFASFHYFCSDSQEILFTHLYGNSSQSHKTRLEDVLSDRKDICFWTDYRQILTAELSRHMTYCKSQERSGIVALAPLLYLHVSGAESYNALTRVGSSTTRTTWCEASIGRRFDAGVLSLSFTTPWLQCIQYCQKEQLQQHQSSG